MNFNKTALLLIDLQNEEGTSDIANMNDILQNTAKVIKKCRQQKIPIIYTRHINRSDGIGLANKEPVKDNGEPIYYHSQTENIEISNALRPNNNDIIIDKYRYSGFYESNLNLMLKSLNIEHLIIGGVLTDVCVLSTALDAYFRDYQINLVPDMCGTTTEGAHKASILMMANWIYDIEIYKAKEMIKKLTKEDYHKWKSEAPDQLQFSTDNIQDVFSELYNN